MTTTPAVSLPSGSEVDSAVFHTPVRNPRAIRDKAQQIRSRSVSKAQQIRSLGVSKAQQIRSLGVSKAQQIRSVGVSKAQQIRSLGVSKADRLQSSIEHSMRTSPAKWVAIAAGAGFGLGFIGRLVQWRNARHARRELIVIDVC